MFQYLLNIPPEIITMILSYLPAVDLRSLLEVSTLIPHVLAIQKSRMKKFRMTGSCNLMVTEGFFENKINLGIEQWTELCYRMNDDIVTINEADHIKIYGIKGGQVHVKKEINPRLQLFAPLVPVFNFRTHVYVDEHEGVIVLSNYCWKRKDFGTTSRWEPYCNITIVDTEKYFAIHTNLEHEYPPNVYMKERVAVLDEYVVICDGKKMNMWDRASGQCMAVLNTNYGIISVAAGQGFFVAAGRGMIKCWNEFEQNKNRLTRKEFREKKVEWIWGPEKGESVALVKADNDIVITILKSPIFFERSASKIVVLNREGKVTRSILMPSYCSHFEISHQNTILSERILVVTLDSGKCQAWDLRTGKTILKMNNLPVRVPNMNYCRTVAVSGQEGLMIACNRNDQMEAWDLISGSYLKDIPTQHILVGDEQKFNLIFLAKNNDLFAINYGGALIKY